MAEQGGARGSLPGVAHRAGEVLRELIARPLPAGLYVVATPIGNLADITLRALAVLARADVIYCEDTRHSRTLLAHFAISRPTRAYHEHNAERERPRVLAELTAGKAVAIISDAGTPLISDPGYKLVREAIAAGHLVTSLPGPSAILASLAAAGLATDAFLFAGFLPPKQKARQTQVGGAEIGAGDPRLLRGAVAARREPRRHRRCAGRVARPPWRASSPSCTRRCVAARPRSWRSGRPQPRRKARW